MVTRYGMDEGLGYVAVEPRRQQMPELPAGALPQGSPVSEHTQQRIDEAILGIVMAGFAQAGAVSQTKRAVLARGTRDLLEKATLDEAALATDLTRADATGAVQTGVDAPTGS